MGKLSPLSNLRLAVLGAPGIGKTTFVKKLGIHWKIPVICTGELIRKEIANRTLLGQEFMDPISKGNLIPDYQSTQLTFSAIGNSSNFVLDSYPRRVESCVLWKQYYNKQINCVVCLEMDEQLLIERVHSRLVCENTNCNTVYNTAFQDLIPKIANVCDICGSKLSQRVDDEYEIILKRITEFAKDLQSVRDFYENDEEVKCLHFQVRKGGNQEWKLLSNLIEENFFNEL